MPSTSEMNWNFECRYVGIGGVSWTLKSVGACVHGVKANLRCGPMYYCARLGLVGMNRGSLPPGWLAGIAGSAWLVRCVGTIYGGSLFSAHLELSLVSVP
jgi:hypothetical protein